MFGAPRPIPLPRRPLDASCRVRRWYENELGWPTVPGDPLRLVVGVRYDILDVPAEAGHAALRRLAPGSPVAVLGDRMRLLVAAGTAEELPGLLEWLEWGTLPLDLTAIGAGGTMEAPRPPGMDTPWARERGGRLPRGADVGCCRGTGGSVPGKGGGLLPCEADAPFSRETDVPRLRDTDTPFVRGADGSESGARDGSPPCETDAPFLCEADGSMRREMGGLLPGEAGGALPCRGGTSCFRADDSTRRETSGPLPCEAGGALPCRGGTSCFRKVGGTLPRERGEPLPYENGSLPPRETNGSMRRETGRLLPDEVGRALPCATGASVPRGTDGSGSREKGGVLIPEGLMASGPERGGLVPRQAFAPPAPETDGALSPEPGFSGDRPLPLGRFGSQGAAVWLRPPEPGCEVEASLPTLSALGRGGDAPDLVRLVNTVATQCHRVRLRRACAQPPALRAQGR
jgi:hypothetical protein